MKKISRRNFLRQAGMGALGTAAAGLLAGCSSPAPAASASAASAAGLYTPGTYTGTAQGMGTVSVTMTFDADSITDVVLDVANETPEIGQAAAETFAEQILANQAAQVDQVSGATVTSRAVQEAAANCIAQAKGEAAAAASVVSENLPGNIRADELQASTCELGDITDAVDGGSYEVIVVGAGTAGIPCAIKAAQDGANVLLLQKEPEPVAQGNTCTGILLDGSDDSAIMNFVYQTMVNNDRRSNWEKIKVYAYHSGEAVQWYYDQAVASGYEAAATPGTVDYGELGKVAKLSVRGKGKPDNTGTVLTSIVNANMDKLDVRYSTPLVQLIKEGDAVTGVYAKDDAGVYYRFTATKGVVLATGDYQNNDAMVAHYCPDVLNFAKKQYHKTGDGHLIGMAAGAQLEPVGHTKMIHDFDSGMMFDEPFLRVDMDGVRFHNEDDDMSYANNFMRNYPPETTGRYCQIFDDTYEEQVTGWGGKPTAHEAMRMYMPEEDVERVGIMPELIDTWKADTLDELAEKIGIDAAALKAAVDRYNEICDLGYDPDFGKNPKYLKKIETAPFWAIRKNIRVSALCSGLVTNAAFAVLDTENQPIPGLYAIGNCSGGFYGAPDYPLHWPGLSIGRCVTDGYVLGKTLAAQ